MFTKTTLLGLGFLLLVLLIVNIASRIAEKRRKN